MTETELEKIGETEVQHRFDRGDYCDLSEISMVKHWLLAKGKERKHLAACKQASISSALDATRLARRANYIAVIAVIIALINSIEQIKNIFW